jgi:hypothetical protein
VPSDGVFPASGPPPPLAVSGEPTGPPSTFVRSRVVRSRKDFMSIDRRAVGRNLIPKFDTFVGALEPQASGHPHGRGAAGVDPNSTARTGVTDRVRNAADRPRPLWADDQVGLVRRIIQLL